MLDALSFPVTFLHATTLLGLCKGPELHVLVIGASQKAEQRVWRITDYWNEIAAFYSTFNVTLVFIGPEVDEHDETRKPGLPSNMKLQCFRGTIGDFLDSHLSSHCTPDTSVVVGYNTGFGNFVESERHELLFSWLPDLNRIAASGIPAVFTCANDYADMNGEFAVQSRVVGAKMLLLPKQNPFSAASHLHEEGQRDTAWSRGSSFMYAICGIDKARHVDIKPGDINLLQKRLDSGMDLHLQDALGRHFYKGMVLTKEQASRCKALIGGSARAPQNAKPSSSQTDKLETPRLELMPGQHDDEVIAAVFVPKIQDASEQIAVDISSSILTVFVPGKYLLRATLPFRVDDDGPAAQAQLTLPFLRILLRKK